MRARAVIGSVVASAAVLVAGWQAGATLDAATVASGHAPGSRVGAEPRGTASPASPTGVASPGAGVALPAPGSSAPGGGGAIGRPAGGAAAAPAPVAPPAPAGAVDGVYTGDLVDTIYGTVQVRVSISGGRITDVAPLKLTDKGSESARYSREAAPILRSEVLSHQSASFTSMSGATYTSGGYLASVQSALDQAGF